MSFLTHNNVRPSLRKAAGFEDRKMHGSQTANLIACPEPGRGRMRMIGAAVLLLAATGAQAQFGSLPVGSMSGNQGVTVTATVAGTVSSVQVLTLGPASEARRKIGCYFEFYNFRRPHSSLGAQTPDQVYFHRPPEALPA